MSSPAFLRPYAAPASLMSPITVVGPGVAAGYMQHLSNKHSARGCFASFLSQSSVQHVRTLARVCLTRVVVGASELDQAGRGLPRASRARKAASDSHIQPAKPRSAAGAVSVVVRVCMRWQRQTPRSVATRTARARAPTSPRPTLLLPKRSSRAGGISSHSKQDTGYAVWRAPVETSPHRELVGRLREHEEGHFSSLGERVNTLCKHLGVGSKCVQTLSLVYHLIVNLWRILNLDRDGTFSIPHLRPSSSSPTIFLLPSSCVVKACGGETCTKRQPGLPIA
jgi:hypothetical protein